MRAGGKATVGRPSLSRAAYATLRDEIARKCRGLCEYHGSHAGQDYHHAVKRSAGGADSADNVVRLCRAAHDLTDAPYATGRLVIRPLGEERFVFSLAVGTKWRPIAVVEIEYQRTEDGPRWRPV